MHGKVDHHALWSALDVLDDHLPLIALLDLIEQRQRIVIIDKAHGLAIIERLECAKNGGMTKTFGNSSCIKNKGAINSNGRHGILPEVEKQAP